MLFCEAIFDFLYLPLILILCKYSKLKINFQFPPQGTFFIL